VRRLTALWSRSLTARLTALATLATAVVLLVVLAGLLALFSRQLDASADAGLADRQQDLRSALAQGDLAEISREPLAVLSRDGRVVRASPDLSAPRALVEPPLSCPGPSRIDDREVAGRRGGDERPLRVRATCQDDGSVLTVAVSVQAQEDARRRLYLLLPIAALVLLVLVALTVGRTVRAALRPVDALTRRAALIAAGADAGLGLPAVGGDDEIARLSATLQQMIDRLGAALAGEQAFVDDASHELRTPVAVLSGEIELALAVRADPDALAQSLLAAHAQAARLRALTEDLLVLARERGSGSGRADSPLADALNATAGRLARPLGLTVRVDCPDGLRVALSVERLERLLTNLLRNAAEAGALQVHVTASAGSDGFEVQVADDGPGFPADYLPRAFDRFSRADAARAGSGTGLGLAIVATIVADAGGTVQAGNYGPLGGALVRLRLPGAGRRA